jgi:cardiolipin synthase A/B
VRLRAGNVVRLLQSGGEYFPDLIGAIDGARQEIFLETYIFEADATGLRVAEALMDAGRRGVDVHVLIDAFGSRQFPAELQARMGDAGMRLLRFRPGVAVWQFRRVRLRRLHRKLAVIDGAIGFCGGINIIDDLNTPGHVPPRFDYAVRVEGPLVGEMRASARRQWLHAAWTQLRKDWRPRSMVRRGAGPAGKQNAALIVRDNLRHRHDIEEAYLSAIAGARCEVIIACAYFLPGTRFRHALMAAAARGVRVVLLLQGRVEYVLLHYSSRALYRQLLEGGVEIHEYRRSFMHAKVAVIDGFWATVGSSNIDPISFLLAREANIVVEDHGFAAQLRASLESAMQAGAEAVHASRWRPPLPERVLTWMVYGLVRLLTGLTGYARRGEDI